MKRFLEMCIKLPLGLLLYLFSKQFRALVKAKMRGSNEPMQAGEEVLVVLQSGPQRKIIGGKS